MPKTVVGAVAALWMLSCFVGCKTSDETTPDAGAALVPTPAIDPAVANDAAAAPVTPPPITPTPVTPTPVNTPKTDAGATDAGAKTDAGATDAGAKTDAGAATIQSCLTKCQQAFAGCLTPQPGKDGGLPTFGDPAKCKTASDTCQAACK
jgi:hypothetical protein